MVIQTNISREGEINKLFPTWIKTYGIKTLRIDINKFRFSHRQQSFDYYINTGRWVNCKTFASGLIHVGGIPGLFKDI
jgi:hypothetical protein